jgi:hypothetical protein
MMAFVYTLIGMIGHDSPVDTNSAAHSGDTPVVLVGG